MLMAYATSYDDDDYTTRSLPKNFTQKQETTHSWEYILSIVQEAMCLKNSVLILLMCLEENDL